MENKQESEIHTFETRLKFISDIFSNLYTKDEILRSCITYKLNKSFEQYLIDLGISSAVLTAADSPIKVLKKVNKEVK